MGKSNQYFRSIRISTIYRNQTDLWIIKIYKFRTELKLKALIPFFIYGITILLVFVSPSWLYADNYLSKIKYRGCYEGTINTGTIYFRESGEFEYRHVGFFGFTTFERSLD